MAKQHRTYLDSPSPDFLRMIVILSVILACINALSFLSSLFGALFFGIYVDPLKAFTFTLIALGETVAAVIFIVFFRQDHVRRNTKMFAYPVALYALSNLLYLIYMLTNWRWDNLANVFTFVLLVLVAADCYYGFKRIAMSSVAIIFAGVCEPFSVFIELVQKIMTSPEQFKLAAAAFSLLVMLFGTIPYLIMILYLRERKAIDKRLAGAVR